MPDLSSLNNLIYLSLSFNNISTISFNAFKVTPNTYLRTVPFDAGTLILTGNGTPLSLMPPGPYGGWVTTI